MGAEIVSVSENDQGHRFQRRNVAMWINSTEEAASGGQGE
jgi:hypothetical protein